MCDLVWPQVLTQIPLVCIVFPGVHWTRVGGWPCFSVALLSSWLNPKGYSWTSHEASWILITGISGGLICHPPDLSGHDWAWTRHTVYCCCCFFNVFIILLGIIPNGLWRKLIHLVWWVFQKLLMKICSPINNKTSAELSYTGQRVRLTPKATCNIKKIQYKGRQSAED